MRKYNYLKDIDWLSISIYLMLVLIGWFTIFAAGYSEQDPSLFDFSLSHGKQLIWIGASIVFAILAMIIDSRFFITFSYYFYGLSVLLLILVLFLGQKVSGSTSWFQIGSIKVQPAEFAKFAATLVVAKYLSELNVNVTRSISNRFTVIGLILLPMILILLQGDTGSALVFIAFLIVLYREGWPNYQMILMLVIALSSILALLFNTYILAFIISVVALLFGIAVRKNIKVVWFVVLNLLVAIVFVFSIDYGFNNFLKPHQKERINVLIGKVDDPKGAAYNVNQSMIAIGSGGFLGKGYLQGTQTKFNFVPEQRTDFIFCTIGEEQGFLGSLILIALYITLLLRVFYIGERQRQAYSRIYAYGVASILFFHFVINIGMTIGLAPVIGIPFPFVSYGGSSLFAFTLLLFVLLKLDADRKKFLKS